MKLTYNKTLEKGTPEKHFSVFINPQLFFFLQCSFHSISVDIPDFLSVTLLFLPLNLISLCQQWQKTSVQALSPTLKGALGPK